MQLSERMDSVLEVLEQTGLSVLSFTSSLISLKQYKNHNAVAQLLSHGPELIDTLQNFLTVNCRDYRDSELHRASEMMLVIYAREVCEASAEANGSHFNVSGTSLTQLEEFSVEGLAQQMEEYAPRLWKLFHVLLDARNWQNELDGDQNMDPEENDEEKAYWEELGEGELEGTTIAASGNVPRGESDMKRAASLRCQVRQHALIKLVSFQLSRMAAAVTINDADYYYYYYTRKKLLSSVSSCTARTGNQIAYRAYRESFFSPRILYRR